MNVAGEDDAFAAGLAEQGDNIEIGSSDKSTPAGGAAADDKAPGGAALEADEGDENGANAGGEGAALDADDDGDEAKEGEKSEGYMKRLKRERAEARRIAADLKIRNETYERIITGAGGKLPEDNAGQAAATTSNVEAVGPKPDPSDQAKYPLGHLDPQYVEDRADWGAVYQAAKQADAALQRQQENQARQQQSQTQEKIMAQVDDLSKRGSEIYDDYQELVVDAGLKGEWPLSQTTFEAAHDAEFGERILYNLAKDKVEAKRVSELSPLAQLRYVDAQNAEIAKTAKPRTAPKAGQPPATRTNGANSSTKISPATENLDDFEKLWLADEKGKK